MKIETQEMKLKNGIEKEWLITNGIGGYSSSTIFGINTRKYHGLLVAPLTPPARRHLILSKLDESITINNKKYDEYNHGNNKQTKVRSSKISKINISSTTKCIY